MTISIDKSIEQEQKDATITTKRQSQYKINSVILNRWSPRSMTGEELDEDTIMSLFEAPRWAPSSYNNQPWRFIYAKRNTSHLLNMNCCLCNIITIRKPAYRRPISKEPGRGFI
jgi:hypothetical protein